MKKRMFAVAAITSLMFAVIPNAQAQGSDGKSISLKFAQTNNEKNKYQLAMLKFKEIIEVKSNGRYTIQVFAGSLGGDRDLMEAVQIGSVDAAALNTAVLASVVPEFGVLDLPFLFRDREHAYKVLDGSVGQDLIKKANAKIGFIGTDYWENGFRGFTNNVRPIVKPEDLKDLKFRTMQSKMHLESFKKWGANPVPMSISEVYTSMQMKLIDGHDNAADTVNAMKMWEVQKYYSESKHFYSPVLFAFSSNMWKKLNDADKKMFLEASKEVAVFERKLAKDMADQAIENLKKNMQVTEKVDYEAFKASVQPIWQSYHSVFGRELIEKIANTK
jgi:tripartite ATP-independent transporter DctP family solute receptor